MLGCYKRPTAAALAFGTTEVILELLIPMLMSAIVDGGLYREENFMLQWLFSPELIANRNRFVLTVGAIMVCVACLSMACGVLAGRFAAVASQGFAKNMRSTLLGKIEDFSFANIDHISTPQLITRATTDINTLRDTMRQTMVTLYRAPVMVTMATVMSFIVSPRLAPLLLGAIPLMGIIMYLLLRVGQPRFKKMLRMMDGMNQAVRENLVASRVVKAFVRGDYESKRFEKTTGDLRRAQLDTGRLFNLSGPLTMGIMWTCSVLILLLGGRQIIFQTTGLLTGELVSLVNYAGMAVNSLSMISWLVMSLSRAQASLNRINEVLDEEIDITDGPSDATVDSGRIDFEDFCFSYTRNPEKLALRHIDLHIASGETIGVIGGTGEGKSTLVSMIPRFYDALSGCVKVDGRDVRDYTLQNLRAGVSMVLQNGSLFSGTIADNLRWADPNATLEQMKEACYIARADEYIDRFPDGYETVLEQNAANLSGGQRQRLLIARAILKKPRILILDDSTSAVDMATDEHIRRCLRTALPGATKLIIAQRINSIMSCDRIVVLEQGRVSDVGTHRELMERSTIYRDVYESQMREGAVDDAAC